MIQARTRSESIMLRAAEALAKELAKQDGADWRLLLDVAIAQAADQMPPMVRTYVRVITRMPHVKGVQPEDL